MPSKYSRSFDGIWGRIDADALKRISKIYGGKSTWRKDECVSFLQAAIKDEERVKAAVQALPEHEHNILALIKYLGGEAERNQLKLAVYAAGIKLPGSRYGYLDPFDDALRKFLRSGMIFNDNSHGSPTDLRNYLGAADMLFSDERVLEHVGSPTFQPIDAQPAPTPVAASTRNPRLITMQMIGVLHTIESLHGLKVTQSGDVRVTELRKLTKLLEWKNDSLVEGDFVIPDAANFTVSTLREAGLLSLQNELLLPTTFAREFSEWPVADQARLLVQGAIHCERWFETDTLYHYGYAQTWPQARFALYTYLNCLAKNQAGSRPFYSIEDLDQGLYQRIGEHFRLQTYVPKFQSLERDQKVVERKYALWLAEQRKTWLKTERVWLEQAFKTWLYFLGLVSLELRNGQLAAVGLSELGWAVLNPDTAARQHTPQPVQQANQIAWIVQPNFDVIAYLDHITNAQLAFLERNAERLRAGDHVAEYRITRESVYRGLEGGLSVDEMLATWQRESGKDLPQNVAVEVREWAALRERITIYRRADLAEYPTAEARQAALNKGLKGTPIGERFLLIRQPLSKAEIKAFYATLDYLSPPMRCLIIEEDGTATITEHPDLVLENQLKEWTEVKPDGSYRLTRASIQRAISTGRTITTLFKILEDRIVRLIPPIMQIALRAWSGQKYQVGIGSVLVLFSPSPDISYAIQNSATLRPFLRGVLAPGYFLVKPELVELLKVKLQEFGLEAQLIEIVKRD